jgi:hypothetical protein
VTKPELVPSGIFPKLAIFGMGLLLLALATVTRATFFAVLGLPISLAGFILIIKFFFDHDERP